MDDGEESDGILYSNILVVFRRYAPVRIYIFNEFTIHIMVLLNKICQIPGKFNKYIENISIENTLHQKKNNKARSKNQMNKKKKLILA